MENIFISQIRFDTTTILSVVTAVITTVITASVSEMIKAKMTERREKKNKFNIRVVKIESREKTINYWHHIIYIRILNLPDEEYLKTPLIYIKKYFFKKIKLIIPPEELNEIEILERDSTVVSVKRFENFTQIDKQLIDEYKTHEYYNDKIPYHAYSKNKINKRTKLYIQYKTRSVDEHKVRLELKQTTIIPFYRYR
jgi:hypothetical protein